MSSNEIVKLDVDMLRTLNIDEQMVVKGGHTHRLAEFIANVNNCSCENSCNQGCGK